VNLEKEITKVDSKESLIRFIDELRHNFIENKEEWENTDIVSFLEAISAWIDDMEGYYQNHNQNMPANPSWRVIANMLYAAKNYE